MQTVAGKKPASHVTAHELAVELITYARSSGALVAVLKQKEADLGQRLLDDACDAARRELREKEERGELVAGARVTNEPCPSCKGSGRLRSHAVTYPRLVHDPKSGAVTCGKCGRNDRNLHFDGATLLGCDACRIGPYVAGEVKRSPSELEAMRERDQARTELDATHERLSHLEDQTRAAWIAIGSLHGPPGSKLGTLAGVIGWLKERVAEGSSRLASSEAAFHAAAKNEQTMCEQLTHVQTRCTELRAELEALRAGAAS